MAISDRIRAEARRTIDGMQKFYERYSDDIDDAEELEHRIARVEASMDGCNGLTQDEKIQKTAENVFELTCAQERSYDALRVELRRMKEQSSSDLKAIKDEIKNGMDGVMKKIEDSGCDSSHGRPSGNGGGWLKFISRIISDNPLLSFGSFIFLLILVFVSGHFEVISKIVNLK